MNSKIIFCHLLNDRSGSPSVLSSVMEAVDAEGIDFIVFTSKSENGFLNNFSDRTINISYSPSTNRWSTLIKYIKSQLVLFKYCVRFRNDSVIFYVNTLLPFGAACAAILFKKKLIYHIHEEKIRPFILGSFLKFIARKYSSLMIFPSKFIYSSFDYSNAKSKVIYNGINFHKSKEPDLRKCKTKSFNVLMVCSLKKFKGVNEFVKIAEHAIPFKDINFSLVLNASDKECEEFFKSQDLPNNLEIYARQEDVGVFYRSNDLLLNLTRPDEIRESFGLTIVEAMNYGLPCIVPKVGGPIEIVEDGIHGFQISCYDTEIIFERILLMATDKQFYNELSKNAKIRSLDFEMGRFKRDIIGVIKAVDEKN